MPAFHEKFLQALFALCLLLTATRCPAQDLRISEFLAINTGGLVDEDGDTSDWAEVHNPGPERVDMTGWYLTDDRLLLTRWRFPAVDLEPGGFLVVFASGKDRRVAGSELHASFRLSGAGEYLALVMPDGETIAHEFAPEFPEQFENVSYGISRAATVTPLVSAGADSRLRVPGGAADGLAWVEPGYDDSSWSAATTGVGFDVGEDTPMETVNLAPGAATTQSSTLDSFNSPLAVDGSFDNFTHTQAGAGLPATWEVDLGGTFVIESIILHNRTSCCASRLRDITVSVLDGAETVFESELLNPENALGGGQLDSGPARLDIDIVALTGGLASGDRVRVVRTPDPDRSGSAGGGNADEPDVLSLAEVEVFGADPDEIGFRSLIATDVESSMHGNSSSVYLRVPFGLESVQPLDVLRLRMKHDDGFVAYLGGVEVARRNAPAPALWNSSATVERADTDAIAFEDFGVTGHAGLLREGENLLAIHGLNVAADDGDFLLLPELVGETVVQESARYFRNPTPGAVNDTAGVIGFVDDTRFSHDRGFYYAPIAVEITTATAGAGIRYTLDGTAPTASHGIVYSGPVAIDSTTMLRAAAFKSGFEPTNVDTQTFIFLDDVVLQSHASTVAAGFPGSWGGTSPDYGMDPDVIAQDGSDRYGGKYARAVEDSLRAVPTLSIVMNIDDMFGANGIYTHSTNRGPAWERPCSVELIHADGTSGFQEDCGIRIQGGAFRSHGLTRKHSLRLLFKAIYGATKLRFPIFGAGASDRIDTITLRANSNDGWQWDAAGSQPLYIRDSFGRETVLAMGGVASHETFAHVYINGVYWGLYNPVERPDASFSATYFGGDKESWDSISNSSVSEGNWDAWNTMVGLANSGLTSLAAYQRIQGKNPDGSDNPSLENYLDMGNLADYMIMNLWLGNNDWPRKNYWCGRRRGPESTGFKFYMWDSEWSMLLRSGVGENRVAVSDGVAAPWPAVRQSPEFQLLFADHVHRHFFNGGALHVDPVRSTWDPDHPERNVPGARFMRLAAQVRDALVAESARWGDQHASTPYTPDEHWAVELDNVMRNYLPQRTAIVLSQFRQAALYPDVDAPSFNQHGGRIPDDFTLVISSSAGTTYYTLDGTDPRLPGGAIHPDALEAAEAGSSVLLAAGAEARILVPDSGALGLTWTQPGFTDSGWRPGATGVGYERNSGYEDLIATDVEASMFQVSSSVYMRLAFEVESLAPVDLLTLRMMYDDGFVAYLNGVEVACRNAPDDPQWNSQASASNADTRAVIFEQFDLTDFRDVLVEGTNVLAVHGLNSSAGSSDLLFVPEIRAADISTVGIPLTAPTLVKARSLDGEWSALNEAFFYFDVPLRITEIMYHPRDPDPGLSGEGDDFEFVEVANVGEAPIDLSGFRLEGGVHFEFSEGHVTSLDPGDALLVTRDALAFSTRYSTAGLNLAGDYSGRLGNAGDSLRLLGAQGEVILEFDYSDRWHPVTDGEGFSLVVVNAFAPPDTWGDENGWQPSARVDGSPGTVDGLEPAAGGWQLPGDLNQDGSIDLTDALRGLLHLFAGVKLALPCAGGVSDPGNSVLLDVNADGGFNLADPVYLLRFLFTRGPMPVAGAHCRPLEGCADVCR